MEYSFNPCRDESQRRVISLDAGRYLVLAPAGCGKTDILAERVERHLALGGDPARMLCLTFTNRASRAMLERISKVSGLRASQVFVGNTHRFCSNFLFSNEILSDGTSILDEQDSASIILNILGKPELADSFDILTYGQREEINYIASLQHFFAQLRSRHRGELLLFGPGKEKMLILLKRLCAELLGPHTFENLLAIYDNAEQYASDMAGYETFTADLMRQIAAARAYENEKERLGLTDFDDLLRITYDYAIAHKDEISKYDWIQVDEVQDLNPLQLAIIDAFSTQDNNVTVYLGDPQQAIFSFIGSKLSILETIRQKCDGKVLHLSNCYRSPKYLLDIFNNYASDQLDTPDRLLPLPTNNTLASPGDLRYVSAEAESLAPSIAAKVACEYPDGRTAIIVSSNAAADLVSEQLAIRHIPHFKISGSDVFKDQATLFAISHFTVGYNESDWLSWAKIFHGYGIARSYASARKIAFGMRDDLVSPVDLIEDREKSVLIDFADKCSNRPYVIFDTETSGLDLVNDDIVQIAAVKVFKNKVIDRFECLLHTSREIPEMLGDIENPLIQLYRETPHEDRAAGLRRFLGFIEGCVLVAHNSDFDCNILHYNLSRDLGYGDFKKDFSEIFDTLRISRLLYPNMKSYRLKSLLKYFGLEGENSHLADDDVMATFSLVKKCLADIDRQRDKIETNMLRYSDFGQTLRHQYGDVYKDFRKAMFENGGDLSAEWRKIADAVSQRMNVPEKLSYVLDFIRNEVIDLASESTIYTQLSMHLNQLSLYREADLCGSNLLNHQVFVATVHKAKGLEFDNVIVYGVIDGVYPFFATNDDPEAVAEDARKLYVAMSRAKRRLCLLTYSMREFTTKMGQRKTFPAYPSPFIRNISGFFG